MEGARFRSPDRFRFEDLADPGTVPGPHELGRSLKPIGLSSTLPLSVVSGVTADWPINFLTRRSMDQLLFISLPLTLYPTRGVPAFIDCRRLSNGSARDRGRGGLVSLFGSRRRGDPYRDIGQSSADGAHRDARSRDPARRRLRAGGRGAASRIRGPRLRAPSAILKSPRPDPLATRTER